MGFFFITYVLFIFIIIFLHNPKERKKMGIIAKGEIHRRNWITAEFASASLMRNDVKMIDRLSSTAKDPVDLLRMTSTFSHLRQKAWLQSPALLDPRKNGSKKSFPSQAENWKMSCLVCLD